MTKSFEKIPPKRSKYIYIFSSFVLTKYISCSFCKFWNTENIFSSSKFPLYWYFLRKNDEIIITSKAHLRKMCIENSPCCNQRCYWFWFFVLETMQMRDNFLSLNLCLKRHDRTTTTWASSFFLYISWSHRKCLLLLWKGKVYKNYGWRQNVFILHVLKTLLISKNVIILWGGTGELEAVKNVVALYRIYLT